MRSIRKTDELIRYGGEEFIIVGEDIDSASGESLALRICDNVRKTPLIVGGSVINVTVSIGGSTFVPGPDDSMEQWVQAVDEYLYMAKINGRDRVEYYRPVAADANSRWFVE
jgi:diguanylate cyclase (GGDEF)-like protein